MDNIRIQTTQNVDIEYELASIGDRILATLLDHLFFIAYILLIVLGLRHSSLMASPPVNFASTLNVVPILLICFGYQNLVPGIVHYLKKNVNHE